MSEQGIPVPFPHQLMHQPPTIRLDYFKAYTVAHPALKQADQAVWNTLREGGRVARERAEETLQLVRGAMKIDFPELR